MINLHLGDCLEAMRQMPDKCYDLAIVDPPYDIHKHGAKTGGKGKLKDRAFCRGKYEHWDISPPQEYFDHLFRVSKNQIMNEKLMNRTNSGFKKNLFLLES